uniref:PSP proline-rich domain-containing protein n=1 Tax=Panagrolaimus sp. PS1159 TaxID=55785 RepID=A0AC35FN02_9BILA
MAHLNGVTDEDDTYGSDENQDETQLTAKQRKELERIRKRNKKKKESKKRKGKESVKDEEEQQIEEVPHENGFTNGETSAKENGAAVEDAEMENIDKPVKEEISATKEIKEEIPDVQIEYVPEIPTIEDSSLKCFAEVFEAFKPKPIEMEFERRRYKRDTAVESTESKAALSEQILQEEIQEKRKELEAAGEAVNLSRKKLRMSMQPSIASLKAASKRADIVEWADVTSRDPFLLVELKTYRNTVTVPKHWNAKRKYLAGKRGFERPPFDLPDFIKRTGIMEMRETVWEKEEAQSLKSKMRERVRPKMGKIDIDYQKLHDAFFKWQTKPLMTKMGELYYEGKELEAQMKDKKPGQLSDELRIALGMPIGPSANRFPPPWLIAMQRYGPPPSYPNLKIPGLNCRIPDGCSFGYHAGGWGKPPVDEYGKPLYGDVFGLEASHAADFEEDAEVDRRLWGEFLTDGEESEEEEEEEQEEQDEAEGPAAGDNGFETPAPTEGFATPSGISTVPGTETPDAIELRKKRTDESSVGGGDTPQLYTILPEKQVDRLRGQMMASTHVYDISKKHNDSIDVSINPDDLENTNKKVLEARYEDELRKKADIRSSGTEDVSDLVNEHVKQANRKRKHQEQKKSKDSSSSKKHKDYKF